MSNSFKVNFIVVVLFLLFTDAIAQKKISGRIVDKLSKEGISFAHIVSGGDLLGVSDFQGNFALEINDDVLTITISCIGYKDLESPISGYQNPAAIEILLEPKTTLLKEVEVLAGKVRTIGHVKKASRGKSGTSFGRGEEDPLKSITVVHSFRIKKEKVRILSFSIFMKDLSLPEYQLNYTKLDSAFGVRLRFVSVNKVENSIKDLVEKNLSFMIQPDSGWFEFDLFNWDIILENIEKTDFYVLMEFFPNCRIRNEQGIWNQIIRTPILYMETLNHPSFICINDCFGAEFTSAFQRQSCPMVRLVYE